MKFSSSLSRLYQGRSWVFVAEGVQRRREFDSRRYPRYPTNFPIEFVQISGVHLIVPGGSGPPASYAAGLYRKSSVAWQRGSACPVIRTLALKFDNL
jgi:hypothetical protein